MFSDLKISFLSWLSVLVVPSLSGQLIEQAIGDPLEPGTQRETAAGTVVIYAGPGFEVHGEAWAWSIYSSAETERWITPLIFEKTNQTDYILRGMGASRGIAGPGVINFWFDPEAGQPRVGPGFTFGFTDRRAYEPSTSSSNSIVTSSRYVGAVDFHYSEGGNWYATSNGLFELDLGQRYSLNGAAGGEAIPLLEDPLGRRSYSARMTAIGVPAVFVATIHPAVEICWNSLLGPNYQIQWSPPSPIDWQDLGTPVVGTGSTLCIFDTTRHGEQRLYRVVLLP